MALNHVRTGLCGLEPIRLGERRRTIEAISPDGEREQDREPRMPS
jgi:hypothetical protein